MRLTYFVQLVRYESDLLYPAVGWRVRWDCWRTFGDSSPGSPVLWSSVQPLTSGFVCEVHSTYIYISTYINTKMCVCLCVCVWVFFRVFLGHLESDWDTLWHKCALMHRNGSKTIQFQKKLFSAELLPFFYISLRFLCKFEERL